MKKLVYNQNLITMRAKGKGPYEGQYHGQDETQNHLGGLIYNPF